MVVSVVIPVYAELRLVQAAVAGLRPPPGTPTELVLVDNAAPDPAVGPWCDAVAAARPDLRVTVLHNAVNAGFPVAVNQGLAWATGDVLVVLNDDLALPPWGLAALVEALGHGWDAVGPVAAAVSGSQRVAPPEAPWPQQAALWAAQAPRVVRPLTRLVWFCIAFTRAALERVGGLDPRFSPGNFEDDDWAVRARLAGLRLGVAWALLVHHAGSASFGRDPEAYRRMLEARRALFARKWRRPGAAQDLFVPWDPPAPPPDPAGRGLLLAACDPTAPDGGAAAAAEAARRGGPLTVVLDPLSPWPAQDPPGVRALREPYPWPKAWALLRGGARWAETGSPLDPLWLQRRDAARGTRSAAGAAARLPLPVAGGGDPVAGVAGKEG